MTFPSTILRAAVRSAAALFCLLALAPATSAQPLETNPDLPPPLHRFEPSILIQHHPQWIVHDRVSDSWLAGIDLSTFLRDAEFSTPHSPGYTAVGFFADPFISRRIGTNARATVGLRLAGAAGLDGLYSWQPLVRLEYSPLPTLHLVMGTLYGDLSHGLYEPMLGRERHFYAHNEEGVQILATIPALRWETDTWLHWENLLQPWQADQERFTLATSNEITPLILPLSPFTLHMSIPFSFLGSHRGGQFSALDTCIQSLFTESVGLRLNFQFSKTGICLHAPFFFYQDISPTSWQAYTDGHGFWPQLSLTFQHSSLNVIGSAGYWTGHHYIAPRGSYLFQCVSWDDPDFRTPDKQMLTARLALEHQYTTDFHLGADAEAYYDLHYRRPDIAFGIYLRYTPSWRL